MPQELATDPLALVAPEVSELLCRVAASRRSIVSGSRMVTTRRSPVCREKSTASSGGEAGRNPLPGALLANLIYSARFSQSYMPRPAPKLWWHANEQALSEVGEAVEVACQANAEHRLWLSVAS